MGTTKLEKRNISKRNHIIISVAIIFFSSVVLYLFDDKSIERATYLVLLLSLLWCTTSWITLSNKKWESLVHAVLSLILLTGFMGLKEIVKDKRYKHLLKAEAYQTFFLPDPYEYNNPVVFAENLKKAKHYQNGQLVSISELHKGNIVFSYIVRSTDGGYTYDGSQIFIKANVLNEHGELVKSYQLENNGCLTFTDYKSEQQLTISTYTKATCSLPQEKLAFLKDLKNLELLLSSPKLKTIEDTLKSSLTDKYTFDREKQLIRTRVGYNDTGDSSSVITYQYDDDGMLLEESIIPYKSEVQMRKRVMTYEPNLYHKNTMIRKLKTFSWGTNGKIAWHTQHYHESKGKLIHSDWYQTGKFSGRTVYEANAAEQILKKTIYAEDKVTIEEVFQYEYNPQGLMIKEIYSTPNMPVPEINEYVYEN